MKKIKDGLYFTTYPAQNSRYNPDIWTKEISVKEIFHYGPNGMYQEANKDIVIKILWTAEHGYFAPSLSFQSHNLTLKLQKLVNNLIGKQNLKAILKLFRQKKIRRVVYNGEKNLFVLGKDKNK